MNNISQNPGEFQRVVLQDIIKNNQRPVNVATVSVGWVQLSADEASRCWNDSLHTLAGKTPFQSFEVGEYFRSRGWKPAYFAHFAANGKIDTLCLCLLRYFTRKAAFVWCVGGPVGTLTTLGKLPPAICAALQLKHVYFRFRCDRPRHISDILRLRSDGWTPVAFDLGANLTMMLDLTKPPATILAQMTKSWRRNLRLAENTDLITSQDHYLSSNALADVFTKMARTKSIDITFPGNELTAFIKKYPNNCALYTARLPDGELVAFRYVLVAGSVAYDYFAATTASGREVRASYLLLWTAMCDLHTRGITCLDLGGIDPLTNRGGYQYKQGTGAASVETLGEWDWATNPFIKWSANRAVRGRALVRNTLTWAARIFNRRKPA